MDAVLEKHLDELSATIDERMAEIRQLRETDKAMRAVFEAVKRSLKFVDSLDALCCIERAVYGWEPTPEDTLDAKPSTLRQEMVGVYGGLGMLEEALNQGRIADAISLCRTMSEKVKADLGLPNL